VVAALLSLANILGISQSLVSAYIFFRWEPVTFYSTAARVVVYMLRIVQRSAHLLSVADMIVVVSTYTEINSKISSLIRVAVVISMNSISLVLYSMFDSRSLLNVDARDFRRPFSACVSFLDAIVQAMTVGVVQGLDVARLLSTATGKVLRAEHAKQAHTSKKA